MVHPDINYLHTRIFLQHVAWMSGSWLFFLSHYTTSLPQTAQWPGTGRPGDHNLVESYERLAPIVSLLGLRGVRSSMIPECNTTAVHCSPRGQVQCGGQMSHTHVCDDQCDFNQPKPSVLGCRIGTSASGSPVFFTRFLCFLSTFVIT